MKPPKALQFLPGLRLNTKLTLAVALLMIVASGVTVRCSLHYFMVHFKEAAVRDQSALVHAVAGELDDKISVVQRELAAVAASIPPEVTHDHRGLQHFLEMRRDLKALFPGGTGYLSPSGVMIATTAWPELVGRDFSFRPYFRRTVETRAPYISEPYLTLSNDGHPSVMFTAPVFDGGSLAGILCGRLDLLSGHFLGRVAKEEPREAVHFYLFNRDGQIVVHRDLGRLPHNGLARNRELLKRVISSREGTVESVGECGELVLSSFTRLNSTGWILAAEAPLSAVYAPWEQTRTLVLRTMAVVLPFSVLLLWLFVRRLTAPLLLLAREVEQMNEGDFTPVAIDGGDEIGVLARVFNRMMVEVGAQRRALEEEKGFSEKLLLNTAVPSLVIDTQMRVLIWNRACEQLTGVSAPEVVGGCEAWRGFYDQKRPVLAELVVQGDFAEMADLYERYSESFLIPDGVRAEGWYVVRGRERYLSFDAAAIRDSSGTVIAAIETIQDLTPGKRKEDELKRMVAATAESEERFRRLVELSLDGIAILVGRLFVFINPAGCDLLGASSPDPLMGAPMVQFVERDSLELFEEQLRYVEQNGQSSPWLEQRLVLQDRSTMDVELGVSPFVYEGQKALQVIFRDITERKLAKARLETLAHYDSLTSLPNRVLFFDRLYHVVEESKRHDYPLALLFIDLDRFKEVNDSLGHTAGDAVLVEVGQRLKDCVRSCDMVARMGGDEFTVILSKMVGEEDAALVAERILDALSVPFLLCGESYTIGGSIGICLFPSAAKDVAEIVSHADSAMYQVKQGGANGYCYYGGAVRHLRGRG
ncbi:diguanylate cyclase [Geomonas sp. RF6]|uniref:sensor domain-containing diguanylate cyclase n=1 Tax=Geomonas sp. RF6 TaxID=2897342 RepID=UPI001E5048C8|nr:diguanylate cyclase [Geomonas sp. RF6]UFS71924.1 diguanylate cyclase [Geomonas sp. RF6]